MHTYYIPLHTHTHTHIRRLQCTQNENRKLFTKLWHLSMAGVSIKRNRSAGYNLTKKLSTTFAKVFVFFFSIISYSWLKSLFSFPMYNVCSMATSLNSSADFLDYGFLATSKPHLILINEYGHCPKSSGFLSDINWKINFIVSG